MKLIDTANLILASRVRATAADRTSPPHLVSLRHSDWVRCLDICNSNVLGLFSSVVSIMLRPSPIIDFGITVRGNIYFS
ncbi:hypothetical protein J6590_065024 [Homalodisca vitripennis]|nr:hypothetical protein J6590_065024 [Homalodisca vitripennis]